MCDVVEGQSNLAPQMSSDNRMLLRIKSGKLQRARKTDAIGAQIIGNAKCVCHHAYTVRFLTKVKPVHVWGCGSFIDAQVKAKYSD